MNLSWPQGLDASRFLAEYWQQKPLLLRNAFTDFVNPLDANELAGLACDEDANARFIEHTGNNEWRLCAGPLSESFFDDVNGNEWSLLVSDVEKLLPEFQQYLEPFRFLPDWRIDDLMISYAPVGGSVGAHVDQYDVFLLQADGIREWQIESSPREKPATSVSQTIALLGDFTAEETFSLEAGDMLYLPPQFAHHGIASDDPCMTWSIGFRAPSVDEMIPEIVNYLIESEGSNHRFKDPQRQIATHPGKIDQTDLKILREMLQRTLTQTDETLNHWIGRFVTEPKDHIQDSTQELAQTLGQNKGLQKTINSVKTKLKNGESVQCNSHMRFAYSLENKPVLYANGQSYPCKQALAEAIADRRLITSDDVADDTDIELLALLCQQQILLLDTAL